MDIEDKFLKDLNPIELNFFQNNSNHNLNTCNKCEIIQNTWIGLKWDIDHNLKGYTALCANCYKKLKCQPYED